MYINKKNIKELAKNSDTRVSPDFYTKLDDYVEALVVRSIERAKQNRRTTLNSRDV